MDVLELDGIQYVKASKAAKAAGYTSDYVGQLCRNGSIKAHLVGRSWYVDASQLREHKSTKKRSQRVKAREQIQKIRAQEESVGTTSHFAKRAAEVSYESDEDALIPEVKKVAVASELPQRQVVRETRPAKEEPAYEIEQEGEKILMSGSVSVVDATDEFLLDPSATVLHPKIEVRKPEKKAPKKKVAKAIQDDSLSTKVSVNRNNKVKPSYSDNSGVADTVVKNQEPSSFLEKLAAADADDELPIEDLNDPARDLDTGHSTDKQYSSLPITSIGLTIAVSCVLLVLLLEGQWTYRAGSTGPDPTPSVTESRYKLDHTDLFAKISF